MTILKKIWNWLSSPPSFRPSSEHPSHGVLKIDCNYNKCKDSPLQLRWERLQLTKEKHDRGWGSWEAPGAPGVLEHYTQYYCPNCDGELTPGPSGAGTNQVCETCNTNFGCLPGALER